MSLNVNGQQEIMAFELLNPQYDKEHETIRYDILNLDDSGSNNIVLSNVGIENNSSIASKSIDRFGIATLFIDSGCDPWDSCG